MFRTLVSYIKPQPDTIAAIFLLKKFGEEQFPGISTATIELWNKIPEGETAESLEQRGYLLLDLGGSRFDHHTYLVDNKPTKCVAEIVAETLGVAQDPALKKLLAFVRRDDLEGKGTISPDPLDRAFGLAGLLTPLCRTYSHDLVGVIGMVLAMFEAHYQEELKRTKLMPAEWKQLSASGAARQWTVMTQHGPLRVVQVVTDNPSMAGWLRAYQHFNLVVLRSSTHHVNLLISQTKPVDLAAIVAQLRAREFRKVHANEPLPDNLAQQGKMPEIPEWYHDTMAKTIQNGGLNPDGVPPTKLSDDEIRQAIVQALQVSS